MFRAVSRRRFTLAAATLAAPVVLPRASLGDDVKVDLVHTFSGADHPVQRVIRAFNDKVVADERVVCVQLTVRDG